jgi:hypothetical protein
VLCFLDESEDRLMSRVILAASTLGTVLLLHSCAPAGGQGQPSFDPLRDSLARDEPQPIYDRNPSHAWNRVFYLLFTRTLKVRLAPVTGGTVFAAGDERLALSNRTVTRIESGDRAVDPLYPSWVWMGSSSFDMLPGGAWGILSEPRYSALVEGLIAVSSTAAEEPPLARALMQADLWAAYDLLQTASPPRSRQSGEAAERTKRIERLLPLLAEAIWTLALTRAEIAALPDTYAAARRGQGLPDLFDPQSGWMEIQWFPTRMHEHAGDNRRAVRVFVKPALAPADPAAFLNRFRDKHGEHFSALDEVALVIQNLLIASDGSVVPSPITYEVQIRRFGGARTSPRSEALQYELSRRQLLEAPHTGGLRALDGQAPVYLPTGGNDFSFASPPAMGPGAEPVLVPLRQRCGSCHGPTLEHMVTFSMITAPGREPPPVVRLDPQQHAHAWDVAAHKMTLESWNSLKRCRPASR